MPSHPPILAANDQLHPSAVPVPSTKKSKKGIILLLLALVLIGGGIAAFLLLGKGDSKTAHSTGDISTASMTSGAELWQRAFEYVLSMSALSVIGRMTRNGIYSLK